MGLTRLQSNKGKVGTVMKCTYALICNTYLNRTSFGIKVTDPSGQVIAEAMDISNDKAKISHLVRLCNHLELSSLHFFDVVDDFIG